MKRVEALPPRYSNYLHKQWSGTDMSNHYQTKSDGEGKKDNLSQLDERVSVKNDEEKNRN